MDLKKITRQFGILCCLSLASISALANSAGNEDSNIYVAKLPDAQVFASFTDELPAVLNYFTTASKQQVIDFYTAAYGEIQTEQLKRKRLTLTFLHNGQNIRIVISEQNNKRQVDILINLNSV